MVRKHKAAFPGKRLIAINLVTGNKRPETLPDVTRSLRKSLHGRSDPDLPSTTVLEEHEWKVLYSKFRKAKPNPNEPPTIREVVRWIAQMVDFWQEKATENLEQLPCGADGKGSPAVRVFCLALTV
jgi:hypothetical protein